MRRLALVAVLVAIALPAWAQDQSLAPDSSPESTNNSCSTSTAWSTMDDDPDSPGTDRCVASTCGANPTNATSWRFTFPTPSSPPSFATDAQSFDAEVRSCAAGGSDADCSLDLYCNGSLVTAGAAQTITSSTGQKITQLHTLTGACASDGSDVEIRLACTATGGTPSARRTVDGNAIEWDATFAPAAGRRIMEIN